MMDKKERCLVDADNSDLHNNNKDNNEDNTEEEDNVAEDNHHRNGADKVPGIGYYRSLD